MLSMHSCSYTLCSENQGFIIYQTSFSAALMKLMLYKRSRLTTFAMRLVLTSKHCKLYYNYELQCHFTLLFCPAQVLERDSGTGQKGQYFCPSYKSIT